MNSKSKIARLHTSGRVFRSLQAKCRQSVGKVLAKCRQSVGKRIRRTVLHAVEQAEPTLGGSWKVALQKASQSWRE